MKQYWTILLCLLSLFLLVSYVSARPPSDERASEYPSDDYPSDGYLRDPAGGAGSLSSISELAKSLTKSVYCLLGPVAMLLVVVAAVVYAVGQVGTSEMRAKAQSWATWALVGAVMAFVIKVVGMMIIQQAFPSTDTSFLTC